MLFISLFMIFRHDVLVVARWAKCFSVQSSSKPVPQNMNLSVKLTRKHIFLRQGFEVVFFLVYIKKTLLIL